MTDGKRLELISATGDDMDRVLSDLRRFSDRNFRLSLSRAQSQAETKRLQRLYGLYQGEGYGL